MKHTYFSKLVFLFSVITLFCYNSTYAQFTQGNLVVLKVGNGSSPLINLGNPCYFQEFSTFGTLLNTFAVPASGANAVCISGSAFTEGQLSKSQDGSQVCFAGYKATPPYMISISNTGSNTVNRAIVSVNQAGTISLAASTSVAFSANNIRSAVSDGGSNFWAAGGNTGVFHMGTLPSDTATVSTTSTNIRHIAIFNSQLYYITSKDTEGLYLVGVGTPSSSGQTSTLLISTGASSSPCCFAMNPNADICYIADDRVTTSGGGVQKWVKSSGIWSLAYTFGSGVSFTEGCRSVCVNWSGSNPVIFATTAETGSNRIIKITDNGAAAIPTTIATSPAQTQFRGIVLAPDNNTVPVVTTASQTNLSPTSVSISGNVINNGSSSITARGICWSTSPNPNLLNNHTTEAGTTGSFTSQISGLTQTTIYYARAYASNINTTYYGNEISFYTPAYIPTYGISQVKGTNAQGEADSNNVYCKLMGVVHGINYANAGLSFYLLDANAGINVFNASSNLGYTVTEGDRLRVIGRILQVRGLTKIAADSIVKISSGNTLQVPSTITAVSENNESWLVRMDNLTYVSGWPLMPGPTATVKALHGNDTVTVTIFSQCPLQGTPEPASPFTIIGLASQYTASTLPPFLSGYMIWPRGLADYASMSEITEADNFKMYPNPCHGMFSILRDHESEVEVSIYNMQGALVYQHRTSEALLSVDVSRYVRGVYLIKISDTKSNYVHTQKLMVQ